LSRGVSAPVSGRNTEALTSNSGRQGTAELTLKQGKPVPLFVHKASPMRSESGGGTNKFVEKLLNKSAIKQTDIWWWLI